MKPISLYPGEPILVRSPNWLGDAIMAIPAILRLHERWPDNPISILCADKLAPLWQMQPAVQNVLQLQSSLWSTAQSLKKHHFIAAVVLPNSFRTAMEVFTARIPFRMGYAVNARSFLLTHSKPPPHPVKTTAKKSLPEIKRSADLIRALTAPDYSQHHIYYYLKLVELADASSVLCAPSLIPQNIPQSEGVLIGFNPGAEYGPAKRWPFENFAATAKQILASPSVKIAIFGGAADATLCDQLARELNSPRVTSLAGKTTLPELAAHLKSCKLLLTNDTGPMHLAAAVGTPVVALFGSTLSDLTAPGIPGDPAHAILQSSVGCSPCFWRECPIDFRCMRQFNPDQVARIIFKKLNLDL